MVHSEGIYHTEKKAQEHETYAVHVQALVGRNIKDSSRAEKSDSISGARVEEVGTRVLTKC